MRAVIQRVKNASVSISGELRAQISHGLLVLLGVEHNDTKEDAEWLAAKIARLRIMADAEGKMNLSLLDTGGEALVVSQFTLHAAYQKGNRPSFIAAARPETAALLYEYFAQQLSQLLAKPVLTGVFGADMQVSLLNDGPVTILMDTKNKT